MRSCLALTALSAVLLFGCHKSGTKAGSSDGGATGATGTTASSGGCGLRTCESAHANCGPIGDGCGNTIDCGTCSETEFCGGGGPSKCGGHVCEPATCSSLGATCGKVADGCGGTVDCGTCSTGFCGGGGANQCGDGLLADGGSPSCHPRTCASAGTNCGPVADGCGGLLQCGTCTTPEVCGAGGRASVCDVPHFSDGGSACTNLCLQQQACDAGATTLSGTVFAPNGNDPLYGALVYVPNGAVEAFTPGVSCLTCSSQVSGEPLVSTTTDATGHFSLSNVPVGSNIPLVIQLGRWRRQVTVTTVAACSDTPVPAALTRLPKNKSEGDIPLTAMVTGNVDALECVLRKIGVDDAEFTNPSGAGRIRLFGAAGDGGGAIIDTSTPDSTSLVDTSSTLDGYDMVLFACEGYQHDKTDTELGNVLSYANTGGRVFATHYEYTWLYSPTTWKTAAAWDVNQGRGNTIVGNIDTSFPKGQAFSQWLDAVNASTAPGSNQIDIDQWRWDVNAVNAPTQQWITTDTQGVSSVQHLTFNTPYNASADAQCGRVLFSDFHVTNSNTTQGQIFPAECTAGPLTAQEHVLEFMLFDLASCITPDQNLTCTARTCADVGATCGPIGDGCGGTVQCGACPAGQTCGGGGTPSQCGVPTCVATTCAAQNIHCGEAGNGCGGTLDCGTCAAGQTCGGGGTPNVCGTPACTPTTCSAQGAQCGTIADGCGRTLDCGACQNGAVCGLSGANLCGSFR